MLGAQLEDLASLSQQLHRTSGDVGACQANATATTTSVVDSVRSAAQTAMQRISAELQALRASVTAAQSSTDSAVWTGANGEVFRGAYADFNAAMQQAEQAAAGTFESFQTSIEQMAQALADHAQTFAQALEQARQSTTSMAGAVEGQRANLDATMNTGFSLG